MVSEFTLAYLLLDGWRLEHHAARPDVAELIRGFQADPASLPAKREQFEDWLRKDGRRHARALLDGLFGVVSYLARTIGGPVPMLIPRADFDALAAPGQNGDGASRSFVRSLKQLVQHLAADWQEPCEEQLLARVEEIVARAAVGSVPRNQRYMSTQQIAKWLGLAPKTVRRLFTEGKLAGRKVGNEWRATREQLEQSPYLRRWRRKGDAALE